MLVTLVLLLEGLDVAELVAGSETRLLSRNMLLIHYDSRPTATEDDDHSSSQQQ